MKSGKRERGPLAFLVAVGLALLLVVVVLPVTVLLGGLAFVPKTAAYWSRARLRVTWAQHGRVLAAMVGMVGIFVLQSTLDAALTPHLGYDLTERAASLDGGLHAAVQAATPGPVALLLAVVYLAGFPVLLYLTPFLAAWLGDGATARRSFLAFLLTYSAALPFYFFAPVREVWTTGRAENLALLTPDTSTLLYSFNGIDNAFPSLHTAMAVACAWFAWKGTSRPWGMVAVGLAVLIPVSTIVLGIHWTIDVVAGLALAAGVIVAVERFVPADRLSTNP